MVQLLTEAPFKCTTQAPHWLVSHPTWVPVRPSVSRRKCTSSVRGSASRLTAIPLTVSDTVSFGSSIHTTPDDGSPAGLSVAAADESPGIDLDQEIGRR